MELRLQSIHFDVSEQLAAFIRKKTAKLARQGGEDLEVEVILKVVKPETALNKETQIRVSLPGGALHAERVCDTFEEGVDLCVDILQRQIVERKERGRQ